jgi:hypothetical protein
MAMPPHVHHRRDGIALICTSPWCTPSRTRTIVWRALLVAGPIAAVAASGALGLRWPSRVALALLAFAALVAWRGTRTPGAPRIEPAPRIDRARVTVEANSA